MTPIIQIYRWRTIVDSTILAFENATYYGLICVPPPSKGGGACPLP